MVTFTELSEYAHSSPVISPLPKLSRFYLDDFAIYTSIDEFHRDLYDPEYIFDQDVIIDTDTHHPDYQRVTCTEDEETVSPRLNEVVDWGDHEAFDHLKQELLVQSDLKQHIRDTLTGEDFVAVVIVDGLSFEAVRNTAIEDQAVVVDGITTTEPGFRRIIYGDEETPDVSISSTLLTNKQFYNSFGFTYWERGDEDLSTDLHSGINEVEQISDFEEGIQILEEESPFSEKTYVQITRMGLDQESHNRKEDPNRKAVVQSLKEDLQMLLDTAKKISNKFRVFVTADHGILWRDQLPSTSNVVCDDYLPHARFVEDEGNIENGRIILGGYGTVTTGLEYPYLTRELKNTEWGVHGGFSYYESVVPLIEFTESDTL
jgi:hypothetical protein